MGRAAPEQRVSTVQAQEEISHYQVKQYSPTMSLSQIDLKRGLG